MLARIAANDMQLMSDAEVSSILDMGVHTKAERKNSISPFEKPIQLNNLLFHFLFSTVNYFSLSERAAGNTINPIINGGYRTQQAHSGDNLSKSIHFGIHFSINHADHFTIDATDVGVGKPEKSTNSSEKRVNQNEHKTEPNGEMCVRNPSPKKMQISNNCCNFSFLFTFSFSFFEDSVHLKKFTFFTRSHQLHVLCFFVDKT